VLRQWVLAAPGAGPALTAGQYSELARQRSTSGLAHKPVDGQPLATLEAENGGLGPRPEAPIDGPRGLARAAQLALERPYSL
jgi:hypothetical protein